MFTYIFAQCDAVWCVPLSVIKVGNTQPRMYGNLFNPFDVCVCVSSVFLCFSLGESILFSAHRQSKCCARRAVGLLTVRGAIHNIISSSRLIAINCGGAREGSIWQLLVNGDGGRNGAVPTRTLAHKWLAIK